MWKTIHSAILFIIRMIEGHSIAIICPLYVKSVPKCEHVSKLTPNPVLTVIFAKNDSITYTKIIEINTYNDEILKIC